MAATLDRPTTEAAEELARFDAFCAKYLRTENLQPLALETFQLQILAGYFAGVRSTLCLIPKKNGKTTLLGALALFHLCSTTEADCVIVASSRDQAGVMLRQIRGFIRRSPELGDVLTVKQREIIYEKFDGRIRILASNVDTTDGVIPTLALVDELHRHKDSDLLGVLRDGLGPRDGQMLTISTAGDLEDSPLGRLRKAAHETPGFVRDGCHWHVRTATMEYHEWALDVGDDRDDLDIVAEANPASWQTVPALKERHDDESMTDWQWARFACGVWLAGEDGAISGKEWAACADPSAVIPADTKGVHIGVDLAWRWDTAAFVPVVKGDDDLLIVGRPIILHPPGDGTSIDDHEHWKVVEEMSKTWPEATFVIDPNAGGESLAQRIDAELPARVAEHNQQPTTMALAAQRLNEAISGARIRHPDDSELTAQILAAAYRPVGEGWRFIKRKKNKAPIDATIALCMAVNTIVGGDEAPKYGRASW